MKHDMNVTIRDLNTHLIAMQGRMELIEAMRNDLIAVNTPLEKDEAIARIKEIPEIYKDVMKCLTPHDLQEITWHLEKAISFIEEDEKQGRTYTIEERRKEG